MPGAVRNAGDISCSVSAAVPLTAGRSLRSGGQDRFRAGPGVAGAAEDRNVVLRRRDRSRGRADPVDAEDGRPADRAAAYAITPRPRAEAPLYAGGLPRTRAGSPAPRFPCGKRMPVRQAPRNSGPGKPTRIRAAPPPGGRVRRRGPALGPDMHERIHRPWRGATTPGRCTARSGGTAPPPGSPVQLIEREFRAVIRRGAPPAPLTAPGAPTGAPGDRRDSLVHIH